jgi:tetratricopeptide (TPR) repeat protein
MIKAQIAFDEGEYQQSISYYTSLIDSDIDVLDCYLGRGEAYMELDQFDKAIADFEQAELKKSNSASFYLAACYALTNQVDESIEWLGKYLSQGIKMHENKLKNHSHFNNIRNSTQWKELWMNEWYSKYETALHHANYLISVQDWVGALDEIDDLIDKKPRMDEAYYARAKIYQHLKEYKLAVNDCDNAIKFNRKNIDYYLLKSDNLFLLEKYSKSLDAINAAISIDNNKIEMYKKRGIIYIQLEQFKKAKEDLALYNLYKTNDFKAYYYLGIAYHKSGDYLNALLNFNEGLKLKETSIECYLARAETYLKTQTFQYAERDLSMALDLNPMDASIYVKRANARKAQGKNEEACSDLKKAIRYGSYEAEKLYYQLCE